MSSHRCRICGREGLQEIVSLGRLPLANSLLEEDQLSFSEPKYPLDLVFCPNCTLVQITETIPPDALFREYAYFSSYSKTMLESSDALSERLVAQQALDASSLVVEIGSNDGYLLQFYQRRGVAVLGIDPARNIARFARDTQGIPTVDEFFDAELAAKLIAESHCADVIHGNNVLAHVANLNSVVEGIKLLLKPNGRAVIEVPYVRELVERGEFDTIYHEHLCYFSVSSVCALLERHNLVLEFVERIPIHGGSLRLFIGHASTTPNRAGPLIEEEQALGMHRMDFYMQLAERMQVVRRDLRQLLHQLKSEGRRVAAYGAAAKGVTLLGYCELGADVIDFVVDRNEYKQGRYLPGARLPIRAPDVLLESRPDYLLILPWNIADEVVAQEAEYRRRGGRFIIPIPEVHVIGGSA